MQCPLTTRQTNALGLRKHNGRAKLLAHKEWMSLSRPMFKVLPGETVIQTAGQPRTHHSLGPCVTDMVLTTRGWLGWALYGELPAQCATQMLVLWRNVSVSWTVITPAECTRQCTLESYCAPRRHFSPISPSPPTHTHTHTHTPHTHTHTHTRARARAHTHTQRMGRKRQTKRRVRGGGGGGQYSSPGDNDLHLQR